MAENSSAGRQFLTGQQMKSQAACPGDLFFCSTSTFTRNSPDNNTVALAAVSPVDVLPGSVNCISQILKLYFSIFFQMYLLRYCLWVYFSAAAGVG